MRDVVYLCVDVPSEAVGYGVGSCWISLCGCESSWTSKRIGRAGTYV